MNPSNIILYEGEYSRLKSVLSRTQRDLQADLVLLIDRNGQQIASEGTALDIDLTSMSSLAAANLAATEGLAQLVGEPEFSILYHQGKHRSIHISSVAKRFSLVLVFNESVSLGMVRLRVKHATAYLEEIFRIFARKMETEARTVSTSGSGPLDFTDEEIDKLFGI
jgi:predicted regulator of Ras-like GTPase activity (Roadblock/LC7/MglB family)